MGLKKHCQAFHSKPNPISAEEGLLDDILHQRRIVRDEERRARPRT